MWFCSFFRRASSDAVGKSFNRVGNDLLQILVTLIDEEIRTRQKSSPSSSDNDSRSETTITKDDKIFEGNKDDKNRGNDESNNTNDQMLRTATKIVGHFARVGKATRPMANFPGFLG